MPFLDNKISQVIYDPLLGNYVFAAHRIYDRDGLTSLITKDALKLLIKNIFQVHKPIFRSITKDFNSYALKSPSEQIYYFL